MCRFGKYLFVLTLLCFCAIGAQAQYTITLTASASSIYIPSTQTITWGATISPSAPPGSSLDIDLSDTTHGNIQGTIIVPENSNTGDPITVPAYGTLSANTMDEVTGVVSCTGCTSTSNTITVNLIVNAPTITFLTRTIDEGSSTAVKASIPAPTDFAITINEIFSPTGDLSIGLLQIAQGATTSNEATATAGATSEGVTVTPYYQYDEGAGTANGQPVAITVEP